MHDFSSCTSETAQTSALPTSAERVATVEGITEYRLANGLRAELVPDQSKSTTTVNITYLAGSRRENYGETGMAHRWSSPAAATEEYNVIYGY